jgi:hypothetical protein
MLRESEFFPNLTMHHLRDMLVGLANFALLSRDELDTVTDESYRPVFRLHPLVHQRVRNSVELRRNRREHYRVLMSLLLKASDPLDPDQRDHWPKWNVLVPHTAYVAKEYLASPSMEQDRTPETAAAAVELAWRSARYLVQIGWFTSACDIIAPIVEPGRPVGLDPLDPTLLKVRVEVAKAQLAIGEHRAGREHLQFVLSARQAALGDEHPETVSVREHLARATEATEEIPQPRAAS